MDVKLIVVEGDTSADEVPVTLPAVIGRGRDAGVTLRHPLISRRHCELYESNGRMHVKDLNSLNGTFVDHNNIDEAVVPAGSLLTVGGFTFRVDYQDAGSGAETDNAETPGGGDDLAAAFEKMTGEIESTDTVEQEADLNLGSLMDLAETDEETPPEIEETPPEISDLDTAEIEIPAVLANDSDPDIEEDSPEGSIPTVQNVDEEIDLNAMFTEQVEEETPAPEPVPEPEIESPVLDLGAVAEPVVESPVPSPSVEDVLDLVDLDEVSEQANTPPAEIVLPEVIEGLEIVDPEQQGPPAKEGDDDDLNSFLNNFK